MRNNNCEREPNKISTEKGITSKKKKKKRKRNNTPVIILFLLKRD
jgi:hypothetical protein